MPLLKNNELKDLASALGKAMVSPTLNFSYAGETLSLNSLDSAFRDQMRILCGYDEVTGRQDVHVFEQNEPLVYSLMETVINEAAPKKVEQQYKGLCEFKRFGENERPVFRLRVTNASRRRALKFISRGAIAGIYDALELAGDVEEGKVEVELQGKTYQNLCRSNAGASIQYMADYEIKDRANYLEVTRIAENNNG